MICSRLGSTRSNKSVRLTTEESENVGDNKRNRAALGIPLHIGDLVLASLQAVQMKRGWKTTTVFDVKQVICDKRCAERR